MHRPTAAPLALVCTVALEAEPLAAMLEGAESLRIGGKSALRGRLEEREVIVLPAGMGKTNAAHGVTALLESHPVAGVVGFGVGGAYPGAGVETGELALATREIYGDEGVLAPGAWLSTREIGIPLVERTGTPLYNELELEAARVDRAARALEAAGLRVAAGPFVTVSSCSGTLARGEELAARYGAVCESMEGAAYAHVCALYDSPFLELRGISNQVEDRDLSRWRLRDAAAIAAEGVRVIVRDYKIPDRTSDE